MYGVTIKRWSKAMNWMVQVIYGDGSFEDRYVFAATAAEAIEIICADTPPSARRWARFIV